MKQMYSNKRVTVWTQPRFQQWSVQGVKHEFPGDILTKIKYT